MLTHCGSTCANTLPLTRIPTFQNSEATVRRAGYHKDTPAIDNWIRVRTRFTGLVGDGVKVKVWVVTLWVRVRVRNRVEDNVEAVRVLVSRVIMDMGRVGGVVAITVSATVTCTVRATIHACIRAGI